MARTSFLLTLIIGVMSGWPLQPLGAQTLNLRIDPKDLTPGGETISTGNNCYRLTTDQPWKGGTIWFKDPIDLTQSFDLEMALFLGCKDDLGADGMVFLFYPEKVAGGYRGEGMGFGGLAPSLGIEIDTWQNYHLADPQEDHIALLVNGSVSHYEGLTPPKRIANVEDCREHQLRIRWDAGRQILAVALDGKEQISHSINLVREIFQGKKDVYWGVSAATGKKHNLQQICFRRIDYNGVVELPYALRERLLLGDILPLGDIQFPKGSANLDPAGEAQLGALVRLLQEQPGLSLELFTHSRDLPTEEANLKLSQQRADAIQVYLRKKGIDGKRVVTRPLGSQFASLPAPGMASRKNWVQVHLFYPIP